MDSRTMLFTVLAGISRRNADARSLIQQGYDRFATAFMDKDLRPIADLLTEDFEWESDDGSVLDRDATLSAIAQQMAGIERVCDMSIRIERLEANENQADVYIRECLSLVMIDETGTRVKAVTEETYHDKWMNTPKGWRFSSCELLTSSTETRPVEAEPRRKAA